MLIKGWQAAWRFHVVIAAALLGAVNFLVAHPELLGPLGAAATATLPAGVMTKINVYAPLVIIFLRLVRQPKATAAVQAAADTVPAAPADPPKDAS